MIGDLLATAIDEVEQALPSKQGRFLYEEPDFPREDNEEVGITSEPVYEDVGLKGRFRVLTEKYLRELEKEAGIKEPLEVPKALIFGDEVK